MPTLWALPSLVCMQYLIGYQYSSGHELMCIYNELYATFFLIKQQQKEDVLLALMFVSHRLLQVWFYNASLWVPHAPFLTVQSIIGGNMALYIYDNHILYYHMDTFSLTVLGYSYLISIDYLVVQGQIRAVLLSLTYFILAGPNDHWYFKVFLGWLGTSTQDTMLCPVIIL